MKNKNIAKAKKVIAGELKKGRPMAMAIAKAKRKK